MALACAKSTTAPTAQCPVGQHVLANSCAYDFVTITIGPGMQGSSYSGTCPLFSPTPASAKANQGVQWVNNTTVTLTVNQSTGVPLVTVNPGQTSGQVYWRTAGNVGFGVAACNGQPAVGYSQYYGALTVTVN
jgi:hypothetical protein